MTPHEKKQALLHALTVHPVISTRQAAQFYRDQGSPNKRASDALVRLQKERLVEGRRRAIGEDKVWRLSKAGRTLQNIDRYPTPLNSRHIPHKLAVVDFWLYLLDNGTLQHFEVEPKHPMTATRIYNPDAFFIWNSTAYLLEVQRTPLTSTRWGEKWKLANEFFINNHYKEAHWQFYPDRILRPKVIVLSNQTSKTIKTGCQIDILIRRLMV